MNPVKTALAVVAMLSGVAGEAFQAEAATHAAPVAVEVAYRSWGRTTGPSYSPPTADDIIKGASPRERYTETDSEALWEFSRLVDGVAASDEEWPTNIRLVATLTYADGKTVRVELARNVCRVPTIVNGERKVFDPDIYRWLISRVDEFERKWLDETADAAGCPAL